MYPQVYEIRIDGDCSKFVAGEMIKGRLIMVLKKEKVVRGILIRLLGKGNVYWESGIKHNNVFGDSETYVNSTYELFVPEDGKQVTLSPGSYEYFFSFQLPRCIPSSIEGQHCFIRYFLQAAIQRPWKDDQIQEAVISVTSISELSIDTVEPYSFQKDKVVGFNICQTGPITLNFMLGKTGFVPGEYVQFGVEIRNTSSTRVNRVHISLKRQLNCHARGETKTTIDKIFKVNGPAAEVGGYLLWQSNFEIPPFLPPSELLACSIITIQYFLQIKLVLEKWTDLKYYVPVVVGTVPHAPKESKKELDACAYHKTPTKLKSSLSRKSSMAMSRKNSVIKSPITGEEFLHMDENNHDQNDVDRDAMPFTRHDLLFSSLPPLDLSYFQSRPDKQQHFKCYEDCDCTSSNPYRVMSRTNSVHEVIQPPRPHSNPGHYWGRSVHWDNEDDL